MSGSSVIPRVDSGKLPPVRHVRATLPDYAAALDIGADDLAELANPVTRIRIHKNTTDALGKALGIIPTQSAAVDLSTMHPARDLDFQSGHPRILWTTRGMDALDLDADHGDGHFALFTIDTTTNRIDTPLAPARQCGAVEIPRDLSRPRRTGGELESGFGGHCEGDLTNGRRPRSMGLLRQ